MLTRKSAVRTCQPLVSRTPICAASKCQQPEHISSPCTVAFAPAAANKPILPTMKYWNVLFLVSPLLLMYFEKSGTLVVGFSSRFRNGDWPEGVWSNSPAARWTTSAL